MEEIQDYDMYFGIQRNTQRPLSQKYSKTIQFSSLLSGLAPANILVFILRQYVLNAYFGINVNKHTHTFMLTFANFLQ